MYAVQIIQDIIFIACNTVINYKDSSRYRASNLILCFLDLFSRPVDNVVITTKGLQDRNINILAGTTVENKGKLILTEIFPLVQKHDIFQYRCIHFINPVLHISKFPFLLLRYCICYICKFYNLLGILFQAAPATGIQGCDRSPLKGFKSSGVSPLCHVNSDEKGQFTFPSLPPGSYKVVPHYEGPHSIKFDVRPVEVSFTVEHESLKIDPQFKVSTKFVLILFKCTDKG